jgi:hypothetical protein
VSQYKKPLVAEYERQREQQRQYELTVTGVTGEEYTVPTDQQLANFASVLINDAAVRLGILTRVTAADALRVFAIFPEIKAEWLKQHREFQQLASGRR